MDSTYSNDRSSVQSGSNVYFAKDEANKCANNLLHKAKSFHDLMQSNAYLMKLRNMWYYYHGQFGFNSHEVGYAGEQGELTTLNVNHFRNLGEHIINMILANRPIMDPRAINTDYKSLAQTYLAKGILDYYMREKGMEDAIKKAVEYAVVLGAGYVRMEWNATAGNDYETDEEGNIIKEGEVEFSNLSPLDVIFDGTKETWDHNWLMVRSFKNRYDLIAKYPEYEKEILSLQGKSSNATYRVNVFSNDDTDDIPVYEFYHKRTESLPEGRYMLFLSPSIVLLDTKMPYRRIPIFRLVPGEFLGTCYGYSPLFDIYPIQEAINSLYSTVLSNNTAFGVQSIFIQKGSDISVNMVEGGMNFFEGTVKPEPIQLTASHPETYKLIEILEQVAETVSGINSVTRGNPEASLKSGTALALVQSMSLQFISKFQQSYVRLVEDLGTGLIEILKDFASAPKVIAVVGRNNKSLLKEFTGEDLSAINRVIVDVGNPLSRCLKRGTLVLMSDGASKKVEDIKIGELVMGPDSKPRTVGNINSDIEMMYDIHSIDKHQDVYYGCNESHILTLKVCSDDKRYNYKKGQIVDITVRDYLKLPKRQQSILMGFKTGIDFPKKELTIPPYILGAWIGDGNSRNTGLTTMDTELANAWSDYAHDLGLKIRIQDEIDSRAKQYFITSGEQYGSSDRNEFMNQLRSLNLIQNKHIPFKYLTSDRSDRLQLLAGLIDTDGHRSGETYFFTQKNKEIINQVVYLSRSLGFRTTVKEYVPTKFSSSELGEGVCWKVTIGGDTWNIPCKLPRKQCQPKEKARDWLNYGIKVTPVKEDRFYGFTLVEEPHFVLADFTVTHNTIAGRVQMAEQLAQMNLLKNPMQYFQVMNTGSLDSVYEGEMSENLLIKGENEAMLEGKPVMSTFLDEHKEHIIEHRAVIADPELRQNPELLQIVLTHIQEHIDHLRNVDADTLQIIGQIPLNPPAMAGQPIPPEMMGQPSQPNKPFPSFFPQNQEQPGMPEMPSVDSNLLVSPQLEPLAN